jgi:hypothetical protein
MEVGSAMILVRGPLADDLLLEFGNKTDCLEHLLLQLVAYCF